MTSVLTSNVMEDITASSLVSLSGASLRAKSKDLTSPAACHTSAGEILRKLSRKWVVEPLTPQPPLPHAGEGEQRRALTSSWSQVCREAHRFLRMTIGSGRPSEWPVRWSQEPGCQGKNPYEDERIGEGLTARPCATLAARVAPWVRGGGR